MSACFCACVMPTDCFAGLRSGVCACSSFFVGIVVGGAGKDGFTSLEEVDARVAFARFGGIVCENGVYVMDAVTLPL